MIFSTVVDDPEEIVLWRVLDFCPEKQNTISSCMPGTSPEVISEHLLVHLTEMSCEPSGMYSCALDNTTANGTVSCLLALIGNGNFWSALCHVCRGRGITADKSMPV